MRCLACHRDLPPHQGFCDPACAASLRKLPTFPQELTCHACEGTGIIWNGDGECDWPEDCWMCSRD